MSVKLHFGMATGSWIVGKALAEMHDLRYKVGEETIGFIKMGFDKDKLNEAISKVELITGNKQSQHGCINVIELISEPAGDKFKMDDAQWHVFKEWLKQHGETLEETDKTITIAEYGYSEKQGEAKL